MERTKMVIKKWSRMVFAVVALIGGAATGSLEAAEDRFNSENEVLDFICADNVWSKDEVLFRLGMVRNAVEEALEADNEQALGYLRQALEVLDDGRSGVTFLQEIMGAKPGDWILVSEGEGEVGNLLEEIREYFEPADDEEA